MYSIFVVLAVIVAVLLAFIVLIQESKGGGLASGFASSNQIMGVRKTTDVIEKATWTLAGLLVVLSVCATLCSPKPESGSKFGNDNTPAAQQPQQPQQPGTAVPGPGAQQ